MDLVDALVSWGGAVPAVAVAVLLLLVPGLVATAPLRLGLMPRVALSGAAGVAAIGCAGILFAALGLRFAAWQPLLLALAAAGVLWPLRRRQRPLPVVRGRVRGWWVLLGWLVAALVIAVVAFAAVPRPDQISQTYDNVFHLSAVARILDTGDASSLTLRTLIETDRRWSFYPAAWHSLVALAVQLLGVPVPVAVNAAWIAVCAAVWLPGVAWLAQVLLPARDPGVVALTALPLGAAFGAFPYGLLTWGTLYPTFLATALLPVALAAPLAGLSVRARSSASRRLPTTVAVLGTLVAVTAIGLAQPRALATWALLIAPFAVVTLLGAYRRARRAGGRSRLIARRALIGLVVALVLVAAAGFAYLVLRLGLFTRPLDDRLGGAQAQATQSVLAGLWQVLSQSWPVGVGSTVTAPAVLLALAVLAGLVVAARTRRLRWVVISYALVAVLFALAAGSDDVFAKLSTALWYKDRYRLSSALPVLGVPLAALGILAVSRRLLRRRPRREAGSLAIVLAWATGIAAALALALGGLTAAVGHVFRMPERAASSEVVSQAQIDFMREVAGVVPADQRLLGDPWDGSALSLLYADREPVFPHVNGQWDADRRMLASQLQDIDAEPAVCAALDALRVRYVLYDPHEFGGGDPAGNHFIGVHTAVEAGLFVPVLTDGDSTLYRIDQCGPLPATDG